jgi:4-alpha-glucanotransferase
VAVIGLPRSSGVQLHVTSLPGGRLGPEAYRFVDWLAAAGQSWWQVLPLGPPDRYRSPYKSRSAFAAWPELLPRDARRRAVGASELHDLRTREAYWIENWERFAGRGAAADQARFEQEWGSLRRYAAAAGLRLFGDVPIYVAPRSADHLAHPELFREDVVAGAPPDAFSSSGQLWGNPLYDWPALRRRRYRWWVQRLRRTTALFDLARIDHFRGFVSYWAVPAGASSARAGRWQRGPGRAPFEVAAAQLGAPLPLVAEDLGVITPAVHRLRDKLGFPGTLVVQFAFEPRQPHSPHRFSNHAERRIIYTGTHDHDTIRGWWESLDPQRRRLAEAELKIRGIAAGTEPWWALIRLTFGSPARVAMIQAQDILGLGSEARMNDPRRATGNWRWQMEANALTRPLARRLRAVTEETGRLPLVWRPP